nr:hypothetical protein [Tanacetum cinerariifolium]
NTVRQSDDFFGADNDMRSLDGVEVDISNISTTYHVHTTPNTRIHKDYPLDNVIGDIQSGVQTRRITVTTDEQGFINAIYEETTHEDLHTCTNSNYFAGKGASFDAGQSSMEIGPCKLENISKEKDDLDTKIEKFKNASQSLDKLIGNQITDNSKRGLGYVSYNLVPLPHTGRFSPPRIDLSHTGLPNFAKPSVTSYGVKPIDVVP